MTSAEACSVSKRLASSLQLRRSADNCLCNVASFYLSIFKAFYLHVLLNKLP